MSPSSSRTKGDFEPLSASEVALMWQSRFGIPEEVFSCYSFYRKAQSIWVCSNAHLPELNYETIGIRMISLKDRPWKPTTSALRIFGKLATKNMIHLTLEQARIFMAGGTQMIQTDTEMDSGYVAVMYGGIVLGCGLYSHDKGSRGMYSNGESSQEICSNGKGPQEMRSNGKGSRGMYSNDKGRQEMRSNGKLISQIPKEGRILLGEGEDI